MKQLKNERGLTLVELLAVIVILAIIAAIAAVAIGNVISNSKDKAILSDAANIIAGAKIAYMDGVCGEGEEEENKCNQEKLKSFVENATATEYEVKSYNEGGKVTYTIKMDNEFGKIKNDKYKPGNVTGKHRPQGIADDEYTEDQILAAMNGEGKKD